MRNKKIPTFKNESQEHAFWEKHDSSDYIDWSKAKHANFPKLAPSKETISLRLPKMLLNDIKTLANKRDVPYQSLIKIFLSEKVNARPIRKVALAKKTPHKLSISKQSNIKRSKARHKRHQQKLTKNPSNKYG